MSLNIFIDANIFLNFYAYSDDDVKQINKLINLINTNELKLYINTHVVDEFFRCRETKISDVLKKFEKNIDFPNLPLLMGHYSESQKFQELKKEINKIQNSLTREAYKDASNQAFPADELFKNIIDSAKPDEINDHVIQKATLRNVLGNPPGKQGSLGDRLHWEYLIHIVPNKTELHVITQDKDYKSIFNDNEPHPVLNAEWQKLKQSKLLIYKDLSSFLAKHFPDIKLSAPPEANLIVQELINTCSFAATHEAVRKVLPIINLLSEEEITMIANAANDNSQISAIMCDEDVNEFYKLILRKLPEQYPKDLKEQLSQCIDSCNI